MKKLPTFLRTIPAAAISLALILTLSACVAQDSTGTGNGAPPGPKQPLITDPSWRRFSLSPILTTVAVLRITETR